MHGSLRLAMAVLALTACDSPSGGNGGDGPRFATPVVLPTLGLGTVETGRRTSELTVHGQWAYTGTLAQSTTAPASLVHVWDVSGAVPVLAHTIDLLSHHDAAGGGPLPHEEEGEILARVGDVQLSDDGRLLLAATEGSRTEGSIFLYDVADPRHPVLLSHYSTPLIAGGVHTAEMARVNGTLYGFLSITPWNGDDPLPSRLVIVDLSDPRAPRQVWQREQGDPYQHDVFVRDGYLFTAEWNDGVGIWDIGGGGRGGSPSAPVRISTAVTLDGHAHNVYWLRDRRTGERRWLFVGEETPAGGGEYSGDVHVVDLRDMASPREVAFYHAAGAGTHNFSVDEANGILYAAFYNGGVRALDVWGDLGACTAAQKDAAGRCDLSLTGRVAGLGLHEGGARMIWGVEMEGSHLYASDMLNGLWKLDITALRD
jgi:hypothetical protein